jgi:hypothetical protein
MRNGHPYSYIDLERDPGVQNLLDSISHRCRLGCASASHQPASCGLSSF